MVEWTGLDWTGLDWNGMVGVSESTTPATANSRGGSWSDEEVKAVIAIWGEDKVQQEVDGAIRNKTVFLTFAEQMKRLLPRL